MQHETVRPEAADPSAIARDEILTLVAAVMTRRWKWGQADCCISAANVFAIRTGIDVAGSMRGAYGSRREAAALIARAGGFVEMAEARAAASGLGRVEDPGAGDLGTDGSSLLICIKPGVWAGKTVNGFATTGLCTRAWR